MKKWLNGKEVAHHWAHQTAASGGERPEHTGGGWNNGSGRYQRQSFEGKAFYSYGTVIARIIEGKNGMRAFVLDDASFSNTTSKHQSNARRAIPEGEVIFRVNCGRRGQSLDFAPDTLREHYLALYRDAETQHKQKAIAARLLLSKAGHLQNAVKVAKYFGISKAKLEKELAKISGEVETAGKLVSEYDAKLAVRREFQYAAKQEARRLRNAAEIANAIRTAENDLTQVDSLLFGYECHLLESRPDLIAKVMSERERRVAAGIEKWLAGESVNLPHDIPCKLRAVGEQLETSQGVLVPLADARTAFGFASARRVSGWHRNGETFAIGDFQLDAVNEAGIVAGCHRIAWQEIERFAKLQGWI